MQLMYWHFLFFLLLFACTPKPNGKVMQSNKENSMVKKPQITATDRLAPGTCRIVAKVQKIKTDYRGTTRDDPCARVPCRAMIVIEKIEGCGSGVTRTLPVHKTILAHFAPTLNPRIAFGGKQYANLKALRVGQRFQAVVDLTNESLNAKEPILISWYSVLP